MVPLSRAIGRKRAMRDAAHRRADRRADGARLGAREPGRRPSDELDAAVGALAARIAEASPRIVALGKQAFYAQIERDEAGAYDLTAPVMARNAANPDAQEGMTAFLEKRPPAWPD